MVFGFVVILVGLALAFGGEESLPVVGLAIIAGLLFVKWAIRPVSTASLLKKEREVLSDNHKLLLMVFGFVVVLAGLALTFADRENLPVACLAVIVGLIFVKRAVRSRIPSGLVESSQPADPSALPAKGRYPLSASHRTLLLIFGMVLILAALGMAFCRTARFLIAFLAIIAGLISVKWAVRGSAATAFGCLAAMLTALAAFTLLALLPWGFFWGRIGYQPVWPFHAAIQGSGRIITETRTVGAFSRISASGASIVNITQGEPQSLAVEADDNILPLIETAVSGDTLCVGYKPEPLGGISPSKPVTVNVTMKQISELEASGSTRIHAESITANDLVIGETGATELAVAALTAQTLNVQISGAGKCDVAGKVGSQVVHGSGAIHYSAGKLESQSAEVHISGAASATVWAKETLTVHASGACHVSYFGTPRVTQEASGASSIKSLGNH